MGELHEGPAALVAAGVAWRRVLSRVDLDPVHEDLGAAGDGRRGRRARSSGCGRCGQGRVLETETGRRSGGPEGVRRQLPEGRLLERPGLAVPDPLPLAPGAQVQVQRLKEAKERVWGTSALRRT